MIRRKIKFGDKDKISSFKSILNPKVNHKNKCGPMDVLDCNGVCGGPAVFDCGGHCYDPNQESPKHLRDCSGTCYEVKYGPIFAPDCTGECVPYEDACKDSSESCSCSCSESEYSYSDPNSDSEYSYSCSDSESEYSY